MYKDIIVVAICGSILLEYKKLYIPSILYYYESEKMEPKYKNTNYMYIVKQRAVGEM